MWELFIGCFDSNPEQEYFDSVPSASVKSTSPTHKISVGSVQEPENVISSIIAENCYVFGVKFNIYGSESLGLHLKFLLLRKIHIH